MLDNNSQGNQNYLIYCDDMVGFNEQDEDYIEVIKHEVGNKENLEDMPLKELEESVNVVILGDKVDATE